MMTASATFAHGTDEIPVVLPVSKVSAKQYLQMIQAGVWENGEKVELIEGVIVPMPPSGPDHNATTLNFSEIFSPAVGKLRVLIQGTVAISDDCIFDPDLCLVRKKPEGYRTKHPEPADISLVVETSNSSLTRDQRVKLPAYAKAGIGDYWIIDLKRKQLLVHRDPHGEIYCEVRTLSGDDSISPLALPELVIRAAAFFE